MTAPRYAELAAKALRTRLDGDGAPPTAARRDDAIDALRRALEQKRRGRTRRKWAGATATILTAAAAAVALWARSAPHRGSVPATAPSAAVASAAPEAAPSDVTVVAHPSGAGASVVANEGRDARAVDEGSRLERGSRLVAERRGRALLALSTGTSLLVDEGADLTVVDRGPQQRFHLAAGKVHASVAKLHDGERFVIDTTDSEVEVRGTAFDVSVVSPGACGGGARTRVVVTEGVVVVRHAGSETRVAAGQSWPAECAAVASAPRDGARAADSARPKGPPAPSAEADPSVLGAQNDLFAQGVAARRRGDARAAVTTFDRFLSAWPASPLAENAAVERMRALRSVDAASAREAARTYLSRYPGGFARAEAEALLSAAP